MIKVIYNIKLKMIYSVRNNKIPGTFGFRHKSYELRIDRTISHSTEVYIYVYVIYISIKCVLCLR